MSWIFVSHSSQDRRAATELGDRLKDERYEALFLDIDPKDGIGAGRDWERVLYRRLKYCGAAIILCSESSLQSKWCFAELTQARAYEKPIFPLKIDDCRLDGVLGGVQAIDLTDGDEEQGYRRLWDGLRASGLDPRGSFRWDPERPPYPGMFAFEEADAGVYFGRRPDIKEVLQHLERMHQWGEARLAVVAGQSGSGKSSLVRAGVIPRLRKDPAAWSVRLPTRRDRSPLDDLLLPPASEAAATGPTPLLFVDQLEELLARPGDDEAALLDAVVGALRAEGSRALALATLRADYLGRFLESPLGAIPHQVVTLGPLPPDRFTEVIEGPAARADLDFDEGLVKTLVEDTANEDALPLLAFTLRELYERRIGRRMTFDAYNALGGIAGAVGKAARGVMVRTQLDAEGKRDLRRAFLKLFDVQPDGSYVRRIADWDEIPDGARPVLNEFINARLIIPGSPDPDRRESVWVVHDALFRAWPTLEGWLDADREFRLWKKRIEPDVKSWSASEDKGKGLLFEDKLVEASKWLDQRPDDLSPAEKGLILASQDRKQRDDEREAGIAEQQRQLVANLSAATKEQSRLLADLGVAADRRRRLLGRLALALSGALLLLLAALASTGFAVAYYRSADAQRKEAEAQKKAAEDRRKEAEALTETVDRQRKEAEAQQQVAERQARVELARRLVAQARALEPPMLGKGLILVTESINLMRSHGEQPLDQSAIALTWGLSQTHARYLPSPRFPLAAAALAAEGRRLAVIGADGRVEVRDRFQDVPIYSTQGRGGNSRVPAFDPEQEIGAIALSEDGRRLAVCTAAGSIQIWDEEDRASSRVLRVDTERPVAALAFSPDGRFLAAGGFDGQTRLWDLDDRGGEPATFGEDEVHVHAVCLGPDGGRLITGNEEGRIRIWDLQAGRPRPDRPEPRVFDDHRGTVIALRMSPDGARLISAANDRVVLVWELDNPDTPPVGLRGHQVPLLSLGVGGGGKRVVGGGIDGSYYIWDLDEPKVMPETERYINLPFVAIALDEAEGRFTTVRSDGTFWDVNLDPSAGFPRRFRGHQGPVLSVAMGTDGPRFVSGSQDGTIRVWDADAPATKPRILRPGGAPVYAVAQAGDGNRVVSGDAGGAILSWDLSQPEPTLLQIARLSGPVLAVALTPGGEKLASGGGDGILRVWDLTRPEDGPLTLDAGGRPVHAVALTPDGKTLASGGADGILRVWDLAQHGRAPLTLDAGGKAVFAVALSPDGGTLVGGGEDGTLRIWDLSAPAARPRSQKVHQTPIKALAISRAGQSVFLASGADSGIAYWNLSDPASEPTPLGMFTLTTSLAMSPDGSSLLAGSLDGIVRIYPLRIDDLIRHAERYAGRNLTREEWAEYFPDTEYRKTFPDLR